MEVALTDSSRLRIHILQLCMHDIGRNTPCNTSIKMYVQTMDYSVSVELCLCPNPGVLETCCSGILLRHRLRKGPCARPIFPCAPQARRHQFVSQNNSLTRRRHACVHATADTAEQPPYKGSRRGHHASSNRESTLLGCAELTMVASGERGVLGVCGLEPLPAFFRDPAR